MKHTQATGMESEPHWSLLLAATPRIKTGQLFHLTMENLPQNVLFVLDPSLIAIHSRGLKGNRQFVLASQVTATEYYVVDRLDLRGENGRETECGDGCKGRGTETVRVVFPKDFKVPVEG